MTVAYPLRLFLDCSTAHLSQAARNWLDASAAANIRMVAAMPCGWFVWAGHDTADGLPIDLATTLRHARAVNADYILFDADAALLPDLPVFDWE